MVYMIIGLAVFTAALIAVSAVFSRRARQEEQMRTAARQLVRGQKLDHAINRHGEKDSIPLQKKMMMVQIFNPRKKYVFDPEDTILIGKSSACQICIQNLAVSARHCSIYMKKNTVFLEDMCSSNGTWIRRGLRRVPVRSRCSLRSGDTIYIVDTKIRVFFFYVNTSFL